MKSFLKTKPNLQKKFSLFASEIHWSEEKCFQAKPLFNINLSYIGKCLKQPSKIHTEKCLGMTKLAAPRSVKMLTILTIEVAMCC